LKQRDWYIHEFRHQLEAPVKPLAKPTLEAIRDEMACFPWGDAELAELIDGRLGIVTPMRAILADIERMRAIDLVNIPPDVPIQPRKR
jgi:hypothetical protein